MLSLLLLLLTVRGGESDSVTVTEEQVTVTDGEELVVTAREEVGLVCNKESIIVVSHAYFTRDR